MPTKNICSQVWQRMVVDVAGNVTPCPFRQWTHTCGNLRTEPWSAVWNSEAYKEIREIMAKEGRYSCCPDCTSPAKHAHSMLFQKKEFMGSDSLYANNMRLLQSEFSQRKSTLRALCTMLTISPSGKCNLRCAHCSQKDDPFYSNCIGENALSAVQDLALTSPIFLYQVKS